MIYQPLTEDEAAIERHLRAMREEHDWIEHCRDQAEQYADPDANNSTYEHYYAKIDESRWRLTRLNRDLREVYGVTACEHTHMRPRTDGKRGGYCPRCGQRSILWTPDFNKVS